MPEEFFPHPLSCSFLCYHFIFSFQVNASGEGGREGDRGESERDEERKREGEKKVKQIEMA